MLTPCMEDKDQSVRMNEQRTDRNDSWCRQKLSLSPESLKAIDPVV